MKKIFIGLLFITLNFNIEIGASAISLLPDFVGYILIYLGMREIEHLSNHFLSGKRISVAAAVVSTITYVIAALGISYTGEYYIDEELYPFAFDSFYQTAGFLLDIATEALTIYIMYQLIKGIEDMEMSFKSDLNSDTLMKLWIASLILSVTTYFMICVHFWSIAAIAMIANVVLALVFIFQFRTTMKIYNSIEQAQEAA